MGNWHCIPSSCVTVHYREYQGAKIRWRYPNESWQEIEGDDFTVKKLLYQGTGFYNVKVKFERYNFNCSWSDDPYNVPFGPNYPYGAGGDFYGPIYNVRLATPATYGCGGFLAIEVLCHGVGGNASYQRSSNPVWINKRLLDNNQPGLRSIKEWFAKPWDGKNVEGNCTFTVTKNGQTVYTETRAVCPEVEKIPCQLNTVNKQIEIKKLPFLEKVEIVPYQYSAYKLPGVPGPINQADPIPAQCLNIYNNAIYVIPPNPDAVKYPNATPFDSFVTQICSAPGCPPPEYQVICDCNSCESCPDGTCPVECDGQICCYSSDGISVKAIASNNYCGGQS